VPCAPARVVHHSRTLQAPGALEDTKARIKRFLLHQQGMVKGAASTTQKAAGLGPGPVDADADVLILTPSTSNFDTYREPSQTPSSAGSVVSVGTGSDERHTVQASSSCYEVPAKEVSAYVPDNAATSTYVVDGEDADELDAADSPPAARRGDKSKGGEHIEAQRMHRCKQCGKEFPRPSGLTIHMHTHTGEKRAWLGAFLSSPDTDDQPKQRSYAASAARASRSART
jgi:hypothetical protein